MAKKTQDPHAALVQVTFNLSKEEFETVKRQLTSESRKEIESVFTTLTDREVQVIRLFYGLGHQAMTKGDIDKKLNFEAGRTARLLDKARRKLPGRKVFLAEKLAAVGMQFPALEDCLIRKERRSKAGEILNFDHNPGQFGRDHAPGCSTEQPCPTCVIRQKLKSVGLLADFDEHLGEWLQLFFSEENFPVAYLKLPQQLIDSLHDNGIISVPQWLALSEEEMLSMPGMGPKRLSDLKALAAKNNWDWPPSTQ